MGDMSLKKLLDRPIAYHRVFVELAGGVEGAVFLSQLFYWSNRTKNKQGWVYKSAKEWEEETGLTRYAQGKSKEYLVDKGVIEITKKGRAPHTIHFRINEDRILSLLKSENLICRPSANRSADPRQINLLKVGKSNTYTTQENTHGQADACQRDSSEGFGFSSKEETSKPAKKFARIFAKWSVKHHFHQEGRPQKGSTLTGWKPSTIKGWEKFADQLIEQFGVKEVKRVWCWYRDNFSRPFTPECRTLPAFTDKFVRIQRAIQKQEWNVKKSEDNKRDDTYYSLTDKEIRNLGIDPDKPIVLDEKEWEPIS
jgi:hypothetical protein